MKADIVPVVAKLRHRLVLERPFLNPDDAGGQRLLFSPVGTVWAEIIPLNGNERVVADTEMVIMTHAIRVRYRSDIDVTHRFRLNARIFDLFSVQDRIGDRQWLYCLAREGV